MRSFSTTDQKVPLPHDPEATACNLSGDPKLTFHISNSSSMSYSFHHISDSWNDFICFWDEFSFYEVFTAVLDMRLMLSAEYSDGIGCQSLFHIRMPGQGILRSVQFLRRHPVSWTYLHASGIPWIFEEIAENYGFITWAVKEIGTSHLFILVLADLSAKNIAISWEPRQTPSKIFFLRLHQLWIFFSGTSQGYFFSS